MSAMYSYICKNNQNEQSSVESSFKTQVVGLEREVNANYKSMNIVEYDYMQSLK